MRLVLAAIALVAVAHPAQAGWRWTGWGTKIADVQAAYAGDPAGDEGTPVSAEAIGSKSFVISAGGISIAVKTNYSENRLSSVTEQPASGADCPAFIAYVEGAFGQAGLAGKRTKWVDAASESQISFNNEEAGTCSARFSKAPRQ